MYLYKDIPFYNIVKTTMNIPHIEYFEAWI